MAPTTLKVDMKRITPLRSGWFVGLLRLLSWTVMVVGVASTFGAERWGEFSSRGRGLKLGSEWLPIDDQRKLAAGGQSYQRSARFIAVKLAPHHGLASITNLLMLPGAGLQDCGISHKVSEDWWLLKLSGSLCRAHLDQPAAQTVFLQELRQLPQVESANPVCRAVGTRLALVCAGELILRLRPEVRPEDYFGARMDQARRVRGTTDQWVLRVPGCRLEEVLEQTRTRAADQRVSWVEPHFFEEAIKQTTDPLYSLQWHLENNGSGGAKLGADVKANAAWALQSGRSNIVIAVIDDGMDLLHPDLKTRLFRNVQEIPNNNLDDDHNGYIDDVTGWDFVDEDANPSAVEVDDEHGTAVAGVAVASANNSVGVAGIAYGCSVLPLRFASGKFSSRTDLLEGIYYAAGRNADGIGRWRGADIINISYGGSFSFALQDAVAWAAQYGRNGLGTPVFASSGNEASKWSSIDIPIGSILGGGTYRIGFRYVKDSSDILSVGEDLARIDDVALVAPDLQTIRTSALGVQGRQDFELTTFPPTGWLTSGSRSTLLPTTTISGAFNGTGGRVSVQLRPQLNSQWSELITPPLALTGDEMLRFKVYISSEGDELAEIGYDGLILRVYDPQGGFLFPIDDPSWPGHPLIWGDPPVQEGLTYPARYSEVISVGASTDVDRRAAYSQYGPELDFVAPSSGGWHGIVTTDRTGTNGYNTKSDYFNDFGGTSAASPLAAGVGALLLSSNPGLSSEDLRQLLRQTCDRIGVDSYVEGRNDLYGYGRLNAARALQRLDVLRFSVSPLPSVVHLGEQYSFSAAITNGGKVLLPSVAITNTLPDYAQIVSISQSLGSASATTREVVFQLGDLKPGAGARVEVVLTATEQGTGVHRYTVSTNRSWGYSLTRTAHAELPRLSIHDTAVLEGDSGTTNAAFVVSLSAPLKVPLTVNFSTSSLFADSTSFIATNGFIVFPPGSTNEQVFVQVTGDLVDEETEFFFVDITANSEVILDNRFALCEILDDDEPPLVSIASTAVIEGRRGNSSFPLSVFLSEPSEKEISVRWVTRPGTALAGKDFIASTGLVFFAIGEQRVDVNLQVVGDSVVEPDEQFFVDLLSPIDATLGQSNAVVTIVNDDGLPGKLDHFGLITPVEPLYANQPFPLQILALDALGHSVTDFVGQVSMHFSFPPTVALSNQFEQGLNGFVISNTFGHGKGLWHWSGGRAVAEGHSRTHSIYYGRGESAAGGGNFNVGTNEGVVVSPPINLQATGLNALLTFAYYMQVQTNQTRDLATVEISTNAGLSYVTLASAGDPSQTNFVKDTKGKWLTAAMDLTPFVGNTVLLRWHFNSVDALLNSTEGWYVDDVLVTLGNNPASVLQPELTEAFVNGQWLGNVSIGGPIKSGTIKVDLDSDYVSASEALEIFAFPDLNRNGLPDPWEARYGLSAASDTPAEGDPDGDGASNREEYLAGTNPLDPFSVLRISRSWIADGQFHLDFNTVGGRFYGVESGPEGERVEWTPTPDRLRGDGNLRTWTVPIRTNAPLSLHRLRILP